MRNKGVFIFLFNFFNMQEFWKPFDRNPPLVDALFRRCRINPQRPTERGAWMFCFFSVESMRRYIERLEAAVETFGHRDFKLFVDTMPVPRESSEAVHRHPKFYAHDKLCDVFGRDQDENTKVLSIIEEYIPAESFLFSAYSLQEKQRTLRNCVFRTPATVSTERMSEKFGVRRVLIQRALLGAGRAVYGIPSTASDAGDMQALCAAMANSCAHCGAANPRSRCSRCRVIYYCSSQCQRADWTTGAIGGKMCNLPLMYRLVLYGYKMCVDDPSWSRNLNQIGRPPVADSAEYRIIEELNSDAARSRILANTDPDANFGGTSHREQCERFQSFRAYIKIEGAKVK
jgi:hypothetical protein